jgi:hypothetical protein
MTSLVGVVWKQYLAWKVVLGIGGAFGLYHLISHIRGSHILGTSNFLNWLGKRMFSKSLRDADVEGFYVSKEVEFAGGRVRRKSVIPAQSADDFDLH